MKKTLALLLCLMMVTALVPAMAQSETVIRVAAWDATTTPYLTAQKEAYEASHPGVTIEYVDLASQEYATLAMMELASGSGADVIDVKELSDLQNWIEQGYVEDLTPYIETSGFDMSNYQSMEECYQSLDGVQYGLPFRMDYWVLYYNMDLFDAAGIDYPGAEMTWEEYKELAIAMASGEGEDAVYGTHHHTWLSTVVNWAVCDGEYTLADGNYENLAYYFQLVQDLEDAGAIMSYNDLKASGLHYRGAFGKGNIAMLPMGYWFVSTLINDQRNGDANEFNWGITSVPHADNVAAGSSFGSPTGCAINANSSQKDAAWDFISWRCGEEGAKATASTGTRPAYVSEDVAAAMSSVEGFPTDEASLAALIPTAVYLEWPIVENLAAIKNIVQTEEYSNIMSRSVSIEEGIANMNERVGEILGN